MACIYWDKRTGRCVAPQWKEIKTDGLPKSSGTYLVYLAPGPGNKRGAMTGCDFTMGRGWAGMPDSIISQITHWRQQAAPRISTQGNGNGQKN